jgi:hypothetical protein
LCLLLWSNIKIGCGYGSVVVVIHVDDKMHSADKVETARHFRFAGAGHFAVGSLAVSISSRMD